MPRYSGHCAGKIAAFATALAARPGGLCADCYLLAANKIIGESNEISVTTLPKVQMPKRYDFIIRSPDRV